MNMLVRKVVWRCAMPILFGLANLVLVANSLHASVTASGEILTVRTAVEIAVRDNPNLAQMQARYKALAEIPTQVGSLPDPTVNFNAMNLPTDTVIFTSLISHYVPLAENQITVSLYRPPISR